MRLYKPPPLSRRSHFSFFLGDYGSADSNGFRTTILTRQLFHLDLRSLQNTNKKSHITVRQFWISVFKYVNSMPVGECWPIPTELSEKIDQTYSLSWRFAVTSWSEVVLAAEAKKREKELHCRWSTPVEHFATDHRLYGQFRRRLKSHLFRAQKPRRIVSDFEFLRYTNTFIYSLT